MLSVCVTAAVATYAPIFLGGCGAEGPSQVATVQGSGISRAALAHWTRIKRLEMQGSPKTASRSTPVALQRQALKFLITADWLQGEAKAQGIDVAQSQVDATYRALLNGPAGQSFARSLRSRGISSTDELLLLRLQALSNKLQAKIAAVAPNASAAARRVSSFAAAYRRHWKQRTVCRPGWVVPECRNGPPLPPSAG
jgi:hypothetical protein